MEILTDFDACMQLEAKHGEPTAKGIYAQLPDPDGTAPYDYQVYASCWGHYAHKVLMPVLPAFTQMETAGHAFHT